MNPIVGAGDFIDGSFWPLSSGTLIESHNPARDFATLYTTYSDVSRVDQAIKAARKAQVPWFLLGEEGRRPYMMRLKAAFDEAVEEMSRTITLEMGKPLRESVGEAKSLGDRIGLILGEGMARVAPLHPSGLNAEARQRAQGVLVVLGPYNFPAHLMNSHIIPALATGNTVVVKPSEFTPWSGEMYAKCVEKAGLPAGVFNLIQGAADVGRALVAHTGSDGILFTGSYRTGRAIQQACLDQPHKIVALEMGGKNCAVVLNDADLHQALAGVVQGAFLSTGQRCTATSRLLVEQRIAHRFIDALVDTTRTLLPGDPMLATTQFGPLAHRDAFERFMHLRSRAPSAGCEVLLAGRTLEGGAFVTPSLHLLPKGQTEAAGYLDEELFGPDICVEIVDDVDHAIERINAMPYGLANSVFTADTNKFEHVYAHTRSGCLNLNRSTNGASGRLPFGGVGRSGNQRPAGIDAVRFTTFPVAMIKADIGDTPIEAPFAVPLKRGAERLAMDVDQLDARHTLENMLEQFRIYFDDVRGPDVLVPLDPITELSLGDNLLDPQDIVAKLAPYARLSEEHIVITVPERQEDSARFLDVVRQLFQQIAAENPSHLLGLLPKQIRRPAGGKLPRSEAMLKRLYQGDFIPKEKKEPVVDLSWSGGPYLSSIDDDPLVILDAGSQIASLGLGMAADTFARALDDGEMCENLVANLDLTQEHNQKNSQQSTVVEDYSNLLCKFAWSSIKYTSYTVGGAEANEKAFDLCRRHGTGGTRVIAFDGSFHGRTLAALHATHNPAKRTPFEFKGYEASYVPFPRWCDPREEPNVDATWIRAWHDIGAGQHADLPDAAHDALLASEIQSLRAVESECKKGNVCAVIVEPMQGEGGDNYATARFFSGLRALTRGLGVPLVFDEVQTGFGLGGPFWWHTLFDLKNANGEADGPDCITSAKKAQLGVCLSVWPDAHPAAPHVAQAQRGYLHALGILDHLVDLPNLASYVREKLWTLAIDYPFLALNPRNQGYAFAFDLPSPHLANQLINQRFYRGFMAYIAGERTVRFRLSAVWGEREVDMLFQGLREALNAITAKARGVDAQHQREAMESYVAPAWEDSAARAESARQSGRPFALNYETLNENPPALLRWMAALPRGPLEKVCDRILSMEGQFTDDKVLQSLQVLSSLYDDGKPAAQKVSNDGWLLPASLLSLLRLVLEEMPTEDTPARAFYAALTQKLGIEPVRLVAEALGARERLVSFQDWPRFADDIVAIENATYEEGRRDSRSDLEKMLRDEGGLGVLLLRRTDIGERVLGYAFGGPVEHYKSDGPKHDRMNGRHNTFYSSNITVASSERGAGIGQRLKSAQVRAVGAMQNDDGSPRYLFMTGRNRIGHTRDMAQINRLFGAYMVELYRQNQYGDRSGQALYYRIPLRRPSLPTAIPTTLRQKAQSNTVLDWSSSIQAPLGHAHPRLLRAVEDGSFTQANGTKLTMSNWVTPDVVRYAEILMRLGPKGLHHTYFTSGRDETVDKGLRSLRVHRPKADLVVGLERQYVGHTTAAARSLSDDDGFAAPFAWYRWPKVPHPAEVGTQAALDAIRSVISHNGAERILAVVVEIIGERSGLTLPADFVDGLMDLHEQTHVPVVAIETASSLGRAGDTLFAVDQWRRKPNVVLWYTGGQLGHIFADDAHYVPKPLTLISTWDGDEISIIRARHHLLEARALLSSQKAAAFAEQFTLMTATTARHTVNRSPVHHLGAGLWQVLDVGSEERAASLRKYSASLGLHVGRGLSGRIIVAPPICVSDEHMQLGLERLGKALRTIVG